MKQITKTLLFALIFAFTIAQVAFAAGNTNFNSTGLNDIVHADDAGDADDGKKKGKKKDKGKDGEEEPDCD
ncbi:MAG TPA: hypothetical protein EYH06_12635 [Chromatiales bacterium]|nr:hypothetical protein [Thiotrichales bacterium]HIP69410.1 hypothetical protein [Chromatiales bacterium]